MPQPPDALAFIEEIRVAEFWRKQLGEIEYSQSNQEDLFRWYQALELRGPDDIRYYLQERACRHPSGPVTGIVSVAPHPTRDIIDIWLATHDRVRTIPYWAGMVAFLLVCMLAMPNLNGCQSLHNPLSPVVWMPPPAILSTGQLSGAPQPLSTLPSNGPPAPVSFASPSAATIAAQNGAGRPMSAPRAASESMSSSTQNSAAGSVSTSSSGSAQSGSSQAPSFSSSQGSSVNASPGSGSQHH